MGKQYCQSSNSERNRLQRSLNQGMSLRAIARALGGSVSTLSRECRRGGSRLDYDAAEGGALARSHRRRGPRKLTAGSPLAELVEQQIIHHAWSLEQIAGRLRIGAPGRPRSMSVVSQIDGPLVKFFEGPPGECCSTISHYLTYRLPLSDTSRAGRQMR